MGPDDAVDDRQAQPGAVMVGAYAFVTALKRFDKCGNHWRGEPFARVLDGELRRGGMNARRDPYGSVAGLVVHDRVVYQVRGHL